MSPPAEQVSLGERFGKYELLALLAVGGTAEVFLARATGAAGFEKVLVVKRLLESLAENREFVEMFLDEARLGARLDHTNIVQTIDLGEVDGRYFIALEYLAGLSLAQLARKGLERLQDGLPVDLSLGILTQACAGLHFAHDVKLPDGTPLKIVHRDVTPQNLIVTYEGLVKVVDFGIAHAAVREAKTKTGMIKGKFAYMSPEQCLGKNIDRKTDVFALGIIAWEILTGQRLFKRESTYKTYQAIVSGETIPHPSTVNERVDPELDAIIMRALAYDAAYRFETADQLGEALTGYLHKRGLRASQGEVRAFYERHFEDELKEHQETQAALLAGDSRAAVPTASAWDVEEVPDPSSFDEEVSHETIEHPGHADPDAENPLTENPEHPTTVDEPLDQVMARVRELHAMDVLTDPTLPNKPGARPGAAAAEVPAELATPTTRRKAARSRLHAMDTEDATQPRLPRREDLQSSNPATALPGEEGALERSPAWVYPLVFVVAAGAGAGILLLLRWLQVN